MNKTEKALRALRALAWAERREVGVILIYGMASSVLFLVVPIGVQTFVNKVGFGTLNQPVLFLVFAVFVALVCAAVFQILQIIVVERLQRRIFARVANELAYRLTRVCAEELSRTDLSEKTNRFLDVATIQKSVALLLLDGFTLVLQAVVGLGLLAFYHPFLLAFDVVMVLAVVFILFGLGRRALSTSIAESSAKYAVLAWLEETSSKTPYLRSVESRDFALNRADALVSQYLKARSQHFRILLRQIAGSVGLQAIASAALLGLGALLVVRNQLTLGQLVAAEIVVTLILTSFQKFQKHLESFYDLVAATGKVDDLLALKQERADGDPWAWGDSPVRIELNEVQFFRQGSSWKLPPLDLTFEPGETVAILGSNGSGKSTLIDILSGMREPTKGTVLFDGKDIRDLRLEELRSGIAVVSDPAIFEASVSDNIRFGNPNISHAQIRNVIQQVGLEKVLSRFEEGLDLKVTDSGKPLSVGEAHQIILARALAGGPKLILIDEWLDGVDEKKREETIQLLSDHPATVIICSHRRDLAERCGRVVELDEDKWEMTG